MESNEAQHYIHLMNRAQELFGPELDHFKDRLSLVTLGINEKALDDLAAVLKDSSSREIVLEGWLRNQENISADTSAFKHRFNK